MTSDEGLAIDKFCVNLRDLPCLNTTLTRLACECEFGQVASSKDI